MATTVIEHANATPAQTWNKLNINDITVEVPSAPASPTAGASTLAEIEMGGGAELTAWIDASAPERETYTIAAASEGEILIRIDDETPLRTIDVVVGEGAAAHVVLIASSTEGTTSTNAFGCALRIRAEKSAQVELDAVSSMSSDASAYLSLGLELGDGANLETHHFALGGKLVVLGLTSNLLGEGCNWDSFVRYLAGKDERLDMNYVARHRGVNSKCVLDFNGVLSENAHKRLADTIDLIHGAKGADGLENETVLVTGDNVINMALPSVLCREDEVAGDHGATIGSIAPEQLEYMEARGLSLADAEKLYTRSVFDAAIMRVPEASEVILAAAERVLGADAREEIEEEHA